MTALRTPGPEIMPGSRASIDADVRTIFLNPDSDQVIRREFDDGGISAGLNLFF